MYNFLTKNGQLLAFGLGILIVGLFLILAIAGGAGSTNWESSTDEFKYSTTLFDLGLAGAIALVVIAAASMLLFGVMQIVTHFKASIRGLIGLLVLAGVFLVAMTMASGVCYDGEGQLAAGICKYIGGAISTGLVLIGLAAVGIVVSEIINFVK